MARWRTIRGRRLTHTVLFRSAALAYGPAVIGVVLTGNLDNGTAGLLAIKDLGGIAIVQDPREAEAPSMPASAIRHISNDHRLRVDEISPMLMSLSNETNSDPPANPPSPLRDLIAVATDFAETETAARAERHIQQQLGTASAIACPECRGVLFEIADQRVLRYRCKLGHGFSGKTLLRDMAAAREEALCSALRAINEEAELPQQLVEAAGTNPCSAAFLGRLADRTADQGRQLRDIFAANSDLIEPPDYPAD